MFLAFFTTPGCFRKVYKMDKEAAARRNTRCIDKEDLFHFLQSYLCGYKSLYILTSCSVNPWCIASIRFVAQNSFYKKRIYNIYLYI